MVNPMGSDGKIVINFIPMPKYVPVFIHLPIIPIPPSLLQLILSSSIGSSTFFLPRL